MDQKLSEEQLKVLMDIKHLKADIFTLELKVKAKQDSLKKSYQELKLVNDKLSLAVSHLDRLGGDFKVF